jgi:hypothetical protein
MHGVDKALKLVGMLAKEARASVVRLDELVLDTTLGVGRAIGRTDDAARQRAASSASRGYA